MPIVAINNLPTLVHLHKEGQTILVGAGLPANRAGECGGVE
jgi:hypothetical protein